MHKPFVTNGTKRLDFESLTITGWWKTHQQTKEEERIKIEGEGEVSYFITLRTNC